MGKKLSLSKVQIFPADLAFSHVGTIVLSLSKAQIFPYTFSRALNNAPNPPF